MPTGQARSRHASCLHSSHAGALHQLCAAAAVAAGCLREDHQEARQMLPGHAAVAVLLEPPGHPVGGAAGHSCPLLLPSPEMRLHHTRGCGPTVLAAVDGASAQRGARSQSSDEGCMRRACALMIAFCTPARPLGRPQVHNGSKDMWSLVGTIFHQLHTAAVPHGGWRAPRQTGVQAHLPPAAHGCWWLLFAGPWGWVRFAGPWEPAAVAGPRGQLLGWGRGGAGGGPTWCGGHTSGRPGLLPCRPPRPDASAQRWRRCAGAGGDRAQVLGAAGRCVAGAVRLPMNVWARHVRACSMPCQSCDMLTPHPTPPADHVLRPAAPAHCA
jgi:hypothetical protein